MRASRAGLVRYAQTMTSSSAVPAPTNTHCTAEMGQLMKINPASTKAKASATAENFFHMPPKCTPDELGF